MTLDAGALIAVERRSDRMDALLRRVADEHLPVSVPAAVLAQVWRGGGRQARLARMLSTPEIEIVALDRFTARTVGEFCARTGVTDVVDVSVVVCARERRDVIATSDLADIRRIDPTATLFVV